MPAISELSLCYCVRIFSSCVCLSFNRFNVVRCFGVSALWLRVRLNFHIWVIAMLIKRKIFDTYNCVNRYSTCQNIVAIALFCLIFVVNVFGCLE